MSGYSMLVPVKAHISHTTLARTQCCFYRLTVIMPVVCVCVCPTCDIELRAQCTQALCRSVGLTYASMSSWQTRTRTMKS